MQPTDVPPAGRKRRSRRLRSPHPGVKIRPPRRALDAQGKPLFDELGKAVWKGRMSYYRLVYIDPETGKEVYERIDPSTHPNDDARADLAKRRARDIAKRRQELEDGAPRATGLTWPDAIEKYLANKPNLDPDTRKEYATHLTQFATWTATVGDVTPDKLARPTLMDFPAWAHQLPKHSPSKGEKRGSQKKKPTKRSIERINTHIRVVRSFLGWLFAKDWLPKIRHETDLKLALKQFPKPENPPEFLDQRELRELIRAALRHDADCYELTREERERLGYKGQGSTPRYSPIAPLVVAAILTGMRIDELCLIEWRTHVDLNATDINGEAMGQIKLRAEDTKTRKGRIVSWEVSPALRRLFAELRRVNGGSKGLVFNITAAEADSAMDRLRSDKFKAPDRFTWQMCRSTCSTFLMNSPGIYGAAAPFHESRQLGHSQKVAEQSYSGLIKGIKHEHRSLEAAMEIETEVDEVIARISAKPKSNVVRLLA